MDDIDRALQQLATAQRASLGDNERCVMMRIDAAIAAKAARPSLGVGLTAATLAMAIGFAVAGVPGRADPARLELSVFSARAALAPATLLAVER